MKCPLVFGIFILSFCFGSCCQNKYKVIPRESNEQNESEKTGHRSEVLKKNLESRGGTKNTSAPNMQVNQKTEECGKGIVFQVEPSGVNPFVSVESDYGEVYSGNVFRDGKPFSKAIDGKEKVLSLSVRCNRRQLVSKRIELIYFHNIIKIKCPSRKEGRITVEVLHGEDVECGSQFNL